MDEGEVTASCYSAPPILEAVIEMVFSEPLTDSVFRKLTKRLKRDYANEMSGPQVSAKLDFQKREAVFSEDGYQSKLTSADEADVLIVQLNVLTWSRLAPYSSWEDLVARVRTQYEDAHAITGHRKLNRIGVRYINRLDIPVSGQVTQYEEYLAINIEAPPLLEPNDNYAWRLERNFPDRGLYAVVLSAVAEAELPGFASFILDIDVTTRGVLPAKQEDIFAKLETMRALKNEIFEVSIRDKARASFSK